VKLTVKLDFVLSAGKQFSKLTTKIDCGDSSHKWRLSKLKFCREPQSRRWNTPTPNVRSLNGSLARRIRQCGWASSVRYFGTVPGGILDAFGRRLRSRNLPTFFHLRITSLSATALAISLSLSVPYRAVFLSPTKAPDGAPDRNGVNVWTGIFAEMLLARTYRTFTWDAQIQHFVNSCYDIL